LATVVHLSGAGNNNFVFIFHVFSIPDTRKLLNQKIDRNCLFFEEGTVLLKLVQFNCWNWTYPGSCYKPPSL